MIVWLLPSRYTNADFKNFLSLGVHTDTLKICILNLKSPRVIQP